MPTLQPHGTAYCGAWIMGQQDWPSMLHQEVGMTQICWRYNSKQCMASSFRGIFVVKTAPVMYSRAERYVCCSQWSHWDTEFSETVLGRNGHH